MMKADNLVSLRTEPTAARDRARIVFDCQIVWIRQHDIGQRPAINFEHVFTEITDPLIEGSSTY